MTFHRSILALAFAAVTACANSPEAPEADATATADPKKDAQLPLPGQLRVAGDATGGLRLLSSLSADGMAASSAFTGVDGGIRRFCAGGADLVAVDRSFTEEEAIACKRAEISWSALSGDGDAPDIYVRREISNAFRASSSVYD